MSFIAPIFSYLFPSKSQVLEEGKLQVVDKQETLRNSNQRVLKMYLQFAENYVIKQQYDSAINHYLKGLKVLKDPLCRQSLYIKIIKAFLILKERPAVKKYLIEAEKDSAAFFQNLTPVDGEKILDKDLNQIFIYQRAYLYLGLTYHSAIPAEIDYYIKTTKKLMDYLNSQMKKNFYIHRLRFALQEGNKIELNICERFFYINPINHPRQLFEIEMFKAENCLEKQYFGVIYFCRRAEKALDKVSYKHKDSLAVRLHDVWGEGYKFLNNNESSYNQFNQACEICTGSPYLKNSDLAKTLNIKRNAARILFLLQKNPLSTFSG